MLSHSTLEIVVYDPLNISQRPQEQHKPLRAAHIRRHTAYTSPHITPQPTGVQHDNLQAPPVQQPTGAPRTAAYRRPPYSSAPNSAEASSAGAAAAVKAELHSSKSQLHTHVRVL